MNTPQDDMPEHDPHISALYRKAGNIEPPASLDEAVLASARRAVRQRRNRWMLPLSTAAVLMLGLTVLLKLNSEWQPGREFKDDTPASVTLEEKTESAAGTLAKRAAPAPAKTLGLNAAPPSSATAPREEQPRQAARAKTEIAESQGFAADNAAMSDLIVPQTDKLKGSESPVISGMAQAEQKVLEPKAWIKKIRKLIEAKNIDEAKKELEAFKKRYPDHKLPDDLKPLIP